MVNTYKSKTYIQYKISILHPLLPYTTWGLIWDLKTMRRDSDIYI